MKWENLEIFSYFRWVMKVGEVVLKCLILCIIDIGEDKFLTAFLLWRRCQRWNKFESIIWKIEATFFTFSRVAAVHECLFFFTLLQNGANAVCVDLRRLVLHQALLMSESILNDFSRWLQQYTQVDSPLRYRSGESDPKKMFFFLVSTGSIFVHVVILYIDIYMYTVYIYIYTQIRMALYHVFGHLLYGHTVSLFLLYCILCIVRSKDNDMIHTMYLYHSNIGSHTKSEGFVPWCVFFIFFSDFGHRLPAHFGAVFCAVSKIVRQ